MTPSGQRLRLRGRVSQKAIDAAAHLVADDLRRELLGSPQSPQTWQAVARQRGIDLVFHHSPDADRGIYYPEGPGGRPVILAYASLPPALLCRVLVHELAHDVLEAWQPPRLPGMADAERYDDDRQTVQHRVARRVEELLVGREGE